MIRLRQVTKRFRSGRGIFDLSLDIQKGEVFGYLGPNGAGKSTTLRILMGFLRPDSGAATVGQHDCWQEATRVHEMVGYLPGELSFMEGMNGMRFLRLLGGMRKLQDVTRRDELIERFELDVRMPIPKMSKGTKQKLGIVAAFMHRPEVLILDEPTSGLDPLMQQRFLELVEEDKRRGATVLLSSHLFPEVERVCDRVGILKDGRIVAVEDVKDLRAHQRRVFTVQLAGREDVQKLQRTGCRIVQTRGDEIDIEVRGDYNRFVKALSQCDVTGMTTRDLGLEEIFMHYYAGQEAL
ncbi:ABC transporter ATP-binding protein [Alicyclobacillus kakegawensis]|uniref:ABC transporter ATP-binding protein n=1 Tax=Alicyclobacillus kakegawensis TaxID=392012 RepID=UPI00082DD03F|nr:ABC transporter ATP-binding protein [Alicyclobacillus kakegawensis]MCL6626874.1 ABC transporter ATP-binding protein [Alicyclobacillus shizuokensis]